MRLTGKPLPRGQTLLEVLKAIVYGRYKATCFHSFKQVYVAQLYQICLITRGKEVYGQEIPQNVCLPLIGPDWK